MTAPQRGQKMVAIRSRAAINQFGTVEHSMNNDDVLVVCAPKANDRSFVGKGMRQFYVFVRRHVRRNLRGVWEQAWAGVGRPRPVPGGWDVDHVFPVCWAEKMGFEYVVLEPTPRGPNRSAGAGVEKAGKSNDQLLAQYVDIDVQGDRAFLGSPAVAKLMNVRPGPGAQQYPGLEQIKPDLEALRMLLAM